MKRKKKHFITGSDPTESPGWWKPDGRRGAWRQIKDKLLIWAAEGMGKG